MSKKIDIIALYMDDVKKSMSVREIARKLNINHQTALNHLKGLVQERIIDSKKKGRNKEHFLNLDNHVTKIFIEMAELAIGYKFLLQHREINVFIEETLSRYPSIVIFGSYAKNYYTKESDLDILIFGKETRKFFEIKEKYPFKIHAQFSTIKRFEQMLEKKKTLALEILKHHIIIGRNDEIIEILWKHYKNG